MDEIGYGVELWGVGVGLAVLDRSEPKHNLNRLDSLSLFLTDVLSTRRMT